MRTLFCLAATATVSGAAEQTCHAVSSVVTDDWCNSNCPSFCPADLCDCGTPTPTPTPPPPTPAPTPRSIKVLSYSGPGAGMDDIDNQHMCFKRDIIPGVTIRGTKKTSIRAGDLDGYDVLLMPGGNPGPEVQNCDRDEVLGFMKRGGGYYGTCAGAMAACTWKSVDPVTGQFNPYNLSETAEPVGYDADGKPIFPKYTQSATFGLTKAVCHGFGGVGIQHNTLTPEGQKAFPNQKSEVDIDHHNGPSFTTEDAGIRLANYQSGQMDGYASIVGDTYQGTGGKVIIVSPHPEHPDSVGVPMNCDIVTYMAAYAAGLDVSEYITV